MKKLMSVLLLLCMLLALLPVAALADEEIAVAPVVESTVEISAEDSAELPETDAPEETADAPVSDTTADESADTPIVETDEKNAEETSVPETESLSEETEETGEEILETYQLPLDGGSGGSVQVWNDGYGTVTVNGTPVTVEVTEYDEITGYSQKVTQVYVPAGETVTIVATPKEGYEFRGWNLSESFYEKYGGTEGEDGSLTFTMPGYSIYFSVKFYRKETITVTAHYSEDGYANEWDWDYSVMPGEPFYLEEPEKNFYWDGDERLEFVGWAVGSPEGERLLANTYYTFEEDTDLYAKFEPGVKLTFHDKGETVKYVPKDIPVEFGSDFTRLGASAFSTEADGSGTVYEVGKTYIFREDTDLYPTAGNVVVVSYYSVKEDVEQTVSMEKGAAYTLRNCYVHSSFGSPGGALQYWAVGSPDSQIHYVPGATVQVDEDIALYPVFAEEYVTVSFHSNDIRDRLLEKCVVAKDCDVILPLATSDEVPQGMMQLGWSYTPDGDPIDGVVHLTEDTTVYAVWAKAALVVYDSNGGSGGSRLKQAVGSYLTNYTAADDLVTREGYTLAGWSLSKDGSERYDFSKPITGNTTLYAVWQQSNETDTPAVKKGEASIGETVYTTLAEALEAAKNSGEVCNIQLLRAVAAAPENIDFAVNIVNLGEYTIAGSSAETVVRNALSEGYKVESTFDGLILIVSEKTKADKVAAMIGEEEYASVQDVLLAAKSGDRITIVEDSNETGSTLIIKAGVTLDLNGKTLAADGLVVFNGAQIVDSGTSRGWLNVDKDAFILRSASNTALPIWVDDSGYKFAAVDLDRNVITTGGTNAFEFVFRPIFDAADASDLVDGGADNGLKFQVTVSWEKTDADGLKSTGSMTYVYADNYVQAVYGANKAFLLSMTGLGGIDLVNITICVVSETTGASIGSQTISHSVTH